MWLMFWLFSCQSPTMSAYFPWSVPNNVRYAFLVSPSSCNIASPAILLYSCFKSRTKELVYLLALSGKQIYRMSLSFVCACENKWTCYRAICRRLARLLPFAIVVQVLVNCYLIDCIRRPQRNDWLLAVWFVLIRCWFLPAVLQQVLRAANC